MLEPGPEPRSPECGHKVHYGKGLCKPCYMRTWRLANHDQVSRYNNVWKRTNRDRVLAAESKPHRKAHRQQYDKLDYETNPVKMKARRLIYSAVRSGRLCPQPCIRCGHSKTEAHHYAGYEKPLDIVWLCTTHHVEAHRGRTWTE